LGVDAVLLTHPETTAATYHHPTHVPPRGLERRWHLGAHQIARLEAAYPLLPRQSAPREPTGIHIRPLVAAAPHRRDLYDAPRPSIYPRQVAHAQGIKGTVLGHRKALPIPTCPAPAPALQRQLQRAEGVAERISRRIDCGGIAQGCLRLGLDR